MVCDCDCALIVRASGDDDDATGMRGFAGVDVDDDGGGFGASVDDVDAE